LSEGIIFYFIAFLCHVIYKFLIIDIFQIYPDFEQYSNGVSLSKFSRNFYLSALLYYRWLPKKVKGFIFHFIRTNRLEEYATYDGLQYSLKIMSVHSSSAINPTLGIEVLAAKEDQLRTLFEQFMEDALKEFPIENN
jgi:acyl carrier protein phosphodiesterase